MNFDQGVSKFGIQLPELPNYPNEYKYGKQIFVKIRNKSKKPVGGVCASQDWSQNNPLAKLILFYKRDILRKHPQIAKKMV